MKMLIISLALSAHYSFALPTLLAHQLAKLLASAAPSHPHCRCLAVVFSQLNHLNNQHILYTTSHVVTRSLQVASKGSNAHLRVRLLHCQWSMEVAPEWESDCPLIVQSQSDLWPRCQKPTAGQRSPRPECVV